MKARSIFAVEIKKADLSRHFPKAKIHKFKPGTTILAEGRHADSCFFLCKGKVAISKKARNNGKIDLGVLSGGQFFGEMAMLSGAKRSATVSALTAVETIEIKRTEFESLVKKADSVASQIALQFAIQLANRSSKTLKIMAKNGITTSSSGSSNPIDVRQVLHKVYSFWAV